MSNPDVAQPEVPEAAPPVRSELAFSLVLFAVACVFFFKARLINSDAEIWPRLLALLLMALTLAQSVRALLTWLKARNGPVVADREVILRRAFAAGWILAYCLVAPWTGFGPAMVVMMPAYMWIAGERRLWMIVLATAFAVGLIWFLFGHVTDVPIWEADL